MRTTLLILVLVVMVAGGVAAVRFLRQPGPYAEPERTSPESIPNGSRQEPERSTPPVGAASCSGRSCHGSLEPTTNPASWQTEYTLWLGHDPHARAYHVLHEPLSQDIARRLGLGAAHTATTCLACHVTPRLAVDQGDAATIERDRRFGVGCEACHGKPEGWIDAHLTEAWRKKPAEEKQRLGMTALADPAVLTKTCAGCHVGAPPGVDRPARDVNHDLIAAGHPRLAFEATSFFANLPRHWRESSAKKRDQSPDDRAVAEARLWAIGQTVAAESALTLLRHRAASLESPWPEFAEYDCAACHHELAAPSARQPAPGSRPGAAPWGTWSFAMAPVLAELAGGEPKLSALDELQRRLGAFATREAASRQGAAALEEIGQLRRRLAEMPLDRPMLTRWLDRVAQHPPLAERPSWERAEQTFLAMHALHRAVDDDSVRRRLARLSEIRALPAGYSSPRGFDPARFMKLLRE